MKRTCLAWCRYLATPSLWGRTISSNQCVQRWLPLRVFVGGGMFPGTKLVVFRPVETVLGTTFTLRLPDKSQCFQGFGIFDEYAVDFGFVKDRTDPTGIICQPCPPGYFSETGLSLGWDRGLLLAQLNKLH